jgi:transcriptional regulator GlxA family with amidase domain
MVNKIFEALPPESNLEDQIRRRLLSRLNAEQAVRAARQATPFLVKATRELPSESERINAAVDRGQFLLRRDFATRWTVEALARRVGCNRTDLEAGFRRRHSETVHGYLITCRVEAAKALLRDTAWRVEEVAKAVGCRSKVSLYAQFRRAMSMTPDEYRRRWTRAAPSDELRELLDRISSD